MARRPLPVAPAAVLLGSADEVEAQFYEALRQGDIERLMALWADDDGIVCVHPGGGRCIGAPAIRASFEAIFGSGAGGAAGGRAGIPVQPGQVHRLEQIGMALHHLVERIRLPAAEPARAGRQAQTAYVLASNLYLKTAQGWRLAAHHASPGTAQEPAALVAEAPSTLH